MRDAVVCSTCRLEYPRRLRACPVCGRGESTTEIATLLETAERAEHEGRAADALAALRDAVDRLPKGSREHVAISARLAALSDRVVDGTARAPRGNVPSWLAGLGALGAALFKLKSVLIFLLAKAKLLLTGLLQIKTLATMALFGAMHGDRRSLAMMSGVVLSIYVHEMGHVAALRRFGIEATAPMFVPGLGAFVRLKQRPATVREDAIVGLAGPIWGLSAALVTLAAYALVRAPVLLDIARLSAWINLFNLIPVWQLDGSRAFAALARDARIGIAVLMAGLAFALRDYVLGATAAFALLRSRDTSLPEASHRATLLSYVAVSLVLAGITALPGSR